MFKIHARRSHDSLQASELEFPGVHQYHLKYFQSDVEVLQHHLYLRHDTPTVCLNSP